MKTKFHLLLLFIQFKCAKSDNWRKSDVISDYFPQF